MSLEDLKAEWIVFAHEYVREWNGTNSYQKAYPNVKRETARAEACRLLAKPSIKAYIEECKQNLAELSGISALRNLEVLKKMAYTDIEMKDDGEMSEEEFSALSNDMKACLAEISFINTPTGTIVKYKVYDRIRAIQEINKMLGLNAPEKIEKTITKSTSSVIKFKKKKKD